MTLNIHLLSWVIFLLHQTTEISGIQLESMKKDNKIKAESEPMKRPSIIITALKNICELVEKLKEDRKMYLAYQMEVQASNEY